MAEVNVPVTKDRIAADILIAMITSGKGVSSSSGSVYFSAAEAAEAFKTIRQALEKQ